MRKLFRQAFVFAIVLGLLAVGNLGADDSGKSKAKSYGFNLGSAMKAGNVVLKAGEYKVRLDGANAIFTREASNENFTIPAKIETGTQKFSKTAIVQSTAGGEAHIVSIDLKGTRDTLKLN